MANKVSDNEIIEACQNHLTMKSAGESLGMPSTTFIRRAKMLGVYRPNQGGKGTNKKSTRRFKLSDILDGKHPTYPTTKLKNRLIKEQVFDNVCVECGVSNEYNGKPITLQLDHVDGINYNHRRDNLRLLCPNCHSQTDTWCGRNK